MIAKINKISGVLIRIPRPTAIGGSHYRTIPITGTELVANTQLKGHLAKAPAECRKRNRRRQGGAGSFNYMVLPASKSLRTCSR